MNAASHSCHVYVIVTKEPPTVKSKANMYGL